MKRKLRKIIRMIRKITKRMKGVMRTVGNAIHAAMTLAGACGLMIGCASDWDRSDPVVLAGLILGSLAILGLAAVLDKKIALPSR